jgi:capsid protein
MVKRAMTDGESLLRRFRRQGGELALRFIEPEKVTDTTNKFAWGIETDPEDVESVRNYHVLLGQKQESEAIPASEVIHVKHGVSVNDLRGWPVLATPREMIMRYGTWLRGRIILNNIRSAMALICYHQDAVPGDLASFADAKSSGTSEVPSYHRGTGVTMQTTRRRQIIPGTVIDAPATDKYEMLTPNIQAADAAQDGRSILLNVAACIGEAEYMVTGDASNANFSSTMVAEAPAVQEFLSWRQELASPLETVWDWVMEHAQQSGLLQLPDGVTLGVIITGPRLVARDRIKEVQSDNVLNQARVLSRRTWASREELDFDEEQQRIEAEDEADLAQQREREPELPPNDGQTPPGNGTQEPGQQPGQPPGQRRPQQAKDQTTTQGTKTA